MSYSLTPSKRPSDKSPGESNGKRKWAKIQKQSLKSGSVFRLLCPVSKIGGVIGKAGHIITKIRQDTGAKVKVEDLVPGCDERVIVISASDKEIEAAAKQSKEDSEEGNDTTEKCEEDNVKELDTVEDSKPEKETSSMVKALLLIFEKMVEEETEVEKGDEESDKSGRFVARLMVSSSQLGCLSGDGNSVFKHISSEIGTEIQVLTRDEVPPFVSASDELVQITGESEAVKKGLQFLTRHLLENPSQDHGTFPLNSNGPSFNSFNIPLPTKETFEPSDNYFHNQDASLPLQVPKNRERGRKNPSQDSLTFRLLCSEENVGGVIGKGGTIVRSLQHDTGCDIKILERVPGSEDRVIIISGRAHPEERVSAPQDAVLRVQTRIYRALSSNIGKPATAKIVFSSNQIGCLLGKGGSIIAEMRKSTGAHIRILPKDQIPKSAPEIEEVIQIHGEFEAVQEALFQVTARLQQHFFGDAFPSLNYPPNPLFPDQVPPFPYRGRRELSPPRMYPHDGFYPPDDRSSFMHDIHGPGFPPHVAGRNPSTAPWGSQGLVDVGGPDGFIDYPGAPPRRIAGYAGASPSPIITNTTMEVIVPRSVVPSIYGEDGWCLTQIKQISDAKIIINDPKPGATETVIIISGTPEQAHAAQSLIQAFVMSEAEETPS